MKSFLDILKEKVVVFDGATGTNIQSQNLTADDFGGEHLNGCNEYLVLSKPSAVEKVHRDYLDAGCDVVETDTFGGTPIVLAEYGLADLAFKLNFEAAKIAKKMASDYSKSGHQRFAAGSMRPTTKLPSLGHISFKEMEATFAVQAKGLIQGGVDLLVVETCQDILQTKAALSAVFSTFKELNRRVPVIASVTIETMGTMLLGTEISAALTSIEPYDVDIIGMNCATGPKEMGENVRFLCENSPRPVFVMPNAGLPENVGGHAHYKLTPEELAEYMRHFVKDFGVNVVGGCCGTTKEHIKRLVEAVGGLSPVSRKPEFTASGSSIYQSVAFHLDPPPIMIGERTNANGSKQFRELLAKEDWEGMVAMGKDQVKEGAHFLDVCVAYVGRDEAKDMRELIPRLNTQITAPLVIDSTEAPVIEEALERIGGKAIVNSINLEDGEERMKRVLPLCKKYGAAVIALTIDESGMAKTAQKKLEIARRIRNIAVDTYGMKEENLIFDALTFTLGSGDEEFRKAGVETIEAIRLIKKEFPRTYTLLGLSNISFGLSPHLRHALNSVFLHYAIEAGLDMAIVHASKIMPLFKIDEKLRELCRRLVFDERRDGDDPLQGLLAHGAAPKAAKSAAAANAPIEERLKNRIIDGNKIGLNADLDEARKTYAPLDIVNNILLDGMKVVGDLFGSGQMQLPFVLQSAEVMKSAVAHLEQFMDKAESTSKGTMVIATVKGDVHDIGKNLVDIILTNNGYKVINLGIRCPLENMIVAAGEHKADAIGMSGLLVKSTLIMKENLEELNQRGLKVPVVLGGAALTRRFVEEDLRAIYKGQLSYANDAFDGLHFMEELATHKNGGAHRTVADVLKEMQSAQRATLDFLERLTDDQYNAPGVAGNWSIHDIVSHLIAWEAHTTERLNLYHDGRKDEIEEYEPAEIDEFNARVVGERKNTGRSEQMKEWHAARKQLVDSVTRLKDGDLPLKFCGGTTEEIIAENSYAHQRHHLKRIKDWLSANPLDGDELSGFEAKVALASKDRAVSSVSPAPDIPRAPFYGTKVVESVDLDEIFSYINEAALFRGQWQVRKGKMSEAEYQKFIEEKVLQDFIALKAKAKDEKLLEPKVVYGYFPCNSEGDDLIIYESNDFSKERLRFTFPRQRKGTALCLSDYFAPVTSGKKDVVAFHMVTMGKIASEYAQQLFQSNNYKDYLYFHGLSVESAEALAELWHRNIRVELGIQGNDAVDPASGKPDVKKYFSQHYRGSRYSFGYPACPSLEDHVKLFKLLAPERIGVELTDGFQLVPEQSTDAIIVHHPEARYFNV